VSPKPAPQGLLREYCLRTYKEPNGTHVVTCCVTTNGQPYEVDRIYTGSRAFTERDIDGILSTLRDTFIRELVVTGGLQLALGDDE
jgi:NADP-dependent 3-hydroxy acid dehydrogenase YdfG